MFDNRKIVIFPFWDGGWGSWSLRVDLNLFVYLIAKRAYISNEPNQTGKEEISIFPFWVGGRGSPHEE